MASTAFERSNNNVASAVVVADGDDQHGSSSSSTTASGKRDDHLAALSLLNDDNALKVTLNEIHVKFISTEWLTEEDGGRAAGSILAKQLLGTKEGLQGSVNLTIEEEFVPVFDTLLIWLSMGDKYLQAELTEENASLLVGLAQYFGLEKLEEAILAEQVQREEEEAKKQAAKQKQEADLFRLFIQGYVKNLNTKTQTTRTTRESNGRIRCFGCGKPTRVAPTYEGKKPRCWGCRGGRYNYDDYSDYNGDDDSWSS